MVKFKCKYGGVIVTKLVNARIGITQKKVPYGAFLFFNVWAYSIGFYHIRKDFRR